MMLQIYCLFIKTDGIKNAMVPGKEQLELRLEKKRGLRLFLLCKKCLPCILDLN